MAWAAPAVVDAAPAMVMEAPEASDGAPRAMAGTNAVQGDAIPASGSINHKPET
jgi:hypothetical protein